MKSMISVKWLENFLNRSFITVLPKRLLKRLNHDIIMIIGFAKRFL